MSYLSPKFCLDPQILRPNPFVAQRRCMTSRNGWMMTDLFCDISESSILSDTLKSFPEQRVKRFVTGSGLTRTVYGDCEGGNEGHSFDDRVAGGGLKRIVI